MGTHYAPQPGTLKIEQIASKLRNVNGLVVLAKTISPILRKNISIFHPSGSI